MEYKCSFCETETWVKYTEPKSPPYRCENHLAKRAVGIFTPYEKDILKHHKKGRDRTRFLVRLRDNFTCIDCGEKRPPSECGIGKKYKKSFDVHHINGKCGKKSHGYDSTKDLEGLITLCHQCHFNRHDHSSNL